MGLCVDIQRDLFTAEFSFWTGFRLLCRDSAHNIDYRRSLQVPLWAPVWTSDVPATFAATFRSLLRAEFDGRFKPVLCLPTDTISCRASLVIITTACQCVSCGTTIWGRRENYLCVREYEGRFSPQAEGVQNYEKCSGYTWVAVEITVL
jgi:hypothetical protein